MTLKKKKDKKKPFILYNVVVVRKMLNIITDKSRSHECHGHLHLSLSLVVCLLSHDTCVSLCICSICTSLLTDLSLLISASSMPVSWLYIMPLAPVSFPNSLSFSFPNSETPRNESDWLSPSLQAIPLMVLIHWGWGTVSHGADGAVSQACNAQFSTITFF